MLDIKPSPGDKVLFTGHNRLGDGKSDFILDSIKYQEFTSCTTFGLALISYTCMTIHNKEANIFDGEWEIVHKVEREGKIKIFFLKGHFTFAAVAQPKNYTTIRWRFSRFVELRE